MHIPEYMKANVWRTFGTESEEWLRNVDSYLTSGIEKWQLEGCRVHENLTNNFICFCTHKTYGDVVLKLGYPYRDLFTEMRALERFDGRQVCRCYERDDHLGAMLLERIQPGDTVGTVIDHQERIHIVTALMSKLPMHIEREDQFPSYHEWITSAFKKTRRLQDIDPRLYGYMDKAEALYHTINARESSKLLHGDLHHRNVLRNGQGEWKAIDPKGVVGPPVLEAGKFLLYEFYYLPADEQPGAFKRILGTTSQQLGIPYRIVAASAFIALVLNVCWSYCAYERPDSIKQELDDCHIFLEQVR